MLAQHVFRTIHVQSNLLTERVTAGKLPEADLAILDEVFKASSAILNVQLRLMNQRTNYIRQGTANNQPLNLIVAAAVGMLAPVLLHRMGRDPVRGSSVILTAATDSMGFLIFLGLAASFLV